MFFVFLQYFKMFFLQYLWIYCVKGINNLISAEIFLNSTGCSHVLGSFGRSSVGWSLGASGWLLDNGSIRVGFIFLRRATTFLLGVWRDAWQNVLERAIITALVKNIHNKVIKFVEVLGEVSGSFGRSFWKFWEKFLEVLGEVSGSFGRSFWKFV